MNNRLVFRAASAAFLALSLGPGCSRHPAGEPWADHAWVRLAAAPGRPAAAYLSVHGGKAPTRIVAVESPAAGSAELHEVFNRSDVGPSVMSMERVDSIDLPADAQLDLAPGGYHAMLFGVSPRVKPGGTVPLTIRFSQGVPVRVEAKVVAAGDPAPY